MSVTVVDSLNLLPASSLTAIEDTQTAFVVRVWITETPDKDGASAMAKTCLDSLGPQGVCILLDPKNKLSSTQFSADVGITAVTERQAARAGNPYFREGHWNEGIAAIINATNQLSTLGVQLDAISHLPLSGAASSETATVLKHTIAVPSDAPSSSSLIFGEDTSMWPWLLFPFGLLLVAAAISITLISYLRKRARHRRNLERFSTMVTGASPAAPHPPLPNQQPLAAGKGVGDGTPRMLNRGRMTVAQTPKAVTYGIWVVKAQDWYRSGNNRVMEFSTRDLALDAIKILYDRDDVPPTRVAYVMTFDSSLKAV